MLKLQFFVFCNFLAHVEQKNMLFVTKNTIIFNLFCKPFVILIKHFRKKLKLKSFTM